MKDVKGLYEKARQFLLEVKVEMKKIAWPNRKETAASTAVVLVLVIIIASFLGLVDVVLSRAVKLILS